MLSDTSGGSNDLLIRINVVQLDPPHKGTMVQRQLDGTF